MTHHIVLAYGKETEHQRAIFAVLSFWAWYRGDRAEAQTVVFTDRPDLFAAVLHGLPVRYEPITSARLEEMFGPQRFYHRAKVAVIDEVARTYPADTILYCDSDTFFVADSTQLLARLQPGTSFMHLRESRLARAVPKWATPSQAQKIQGAIDLVDSQPFRVGTRQQQFHKNQFMWNAGVLGLTSETTRLLPDVYALTDTVYAASEWILAEQVAFSLVLPTETVIQASSHYVFHYWLQPMKALMDQLLGEVLTSEFGGRPLEERLAQVRQLTTRWPRTIVASNVRQEVAQAFSDGALVGGMKSALLALKTLPVAHFLKV